MCIVSKAQHRIMAQINTARRDAFEQTLKDTSANPDVLRYERALWKSLMNTNLRWQTLSPIFLPNRVSTEAFQLQLRTTLFLPLLEGPVTQHCEVCSNLCNDVIRGHHQIFRCKMVGASERAAKIKRKLAQTLQQVLRFASIDDEPKYARFFPVPDVADENVRDERGDILITQESRRIFVDTTTVAPRYNATFEKQHAVEDKVKLKLAKAKNWKGLLPQFAPVAFDVLGHASNSTLEFVERLTELEPSNDTVRPRVLSSLAVAMVRGNHSNYERYRYLTDPAYAAPDYQPAEADRDNSQSDAEGGASPRPTAAATTTSTTTTTTTTAQSPTPRTAQTKRETPASTPRARRVKGQSPSRVIAQVTPGPISSASWANLVRVAATAEPIPFGNLGSDSPFQAGTS